MVTALRLAYAGFVGGLALAGCAVTLDQDQALTTIPYALDPTGRIVVDVRLNDRGPFRFAIDTAATGSFVFAAARESAGLETEPGITTSVYGAVASGRFPVVDLAALSIGGIDWEQARLIALPSDTIATAAIDGILGADFLRRYIVAFAVRDRMMRLYDPGSIDASRYAGWAAIDLEPRTFGNAVEPLRFFEIAIADHRVPALFDLGAGISMLNTAAARSLRLSTLRQDRAGEFAGALGSEPIIAELGTQDLETGRIRWRNESFLIADPEIFATLDYADRPLAILGSGLFNQRDFLIDLQRERVLIRTSMSETEGDRE